MQTIDLRRDEHKNEKEGKQFTTELLLLIGYESCAVY